MSIFTYRQLENVGSEEHEMVSGGDPVALVDHKVIKSSALAPLPLDFLVLYFICLLYTNR